MEQTRHYVCKECSSPVPPAHKFCGACGATVPDAALERKVEYFGAMAALSKAKLILIRGTDGNDGMSYILQGHEHLVGRNSVHIPFPHDPFVDEKHANFFYRADRLVVRDEGSINGLYVRLQEPVILSPGDQFLVGEQVLRLENPGKDTSDAGEDQTFFFSSPKRAINFRVQQILRGGQIGSEMGARETSLTLGREDCDFNFPDDVYISGQHAKIEQLSDGRFQLTDLGSRNGSYIRVRGEKELAHGDYLFIGQQLLRVEQTN